MTATDDIVLHDHNSGNGTQKDRVGGEVRREFVAARQEVPRAHREANSSRNETAPPDILDIRLDACGLACENSTYDKAGKEGS